LGPQSAAKRFKALLHRPLIPIFISLASGIVFFQGLPTDRVALILAAGLALALTVLAVVLSRPRNILIWVAFFLAGGLLELSLQSPSVLKHYAESRALVRLEATVLEVPDLEGDVGRFSVKVSRMTYGEEIMELSEMIKISVYGNCPRLMPGEKILFPARLKPFTNFKNPGAYDYEKAMALKGFSCSASVSDGRRIVPLGKGNLEPMEALSELLRRPVRELLSKTLEGDRHALLRALILGERQDLSPELREQFSRTGLSHALAVSGLHVGMVAWAAFAILRWLMLRSYRLSLALDVQRGSALLAFFPAVAYSLLAGFQVSTQRALIMLGVLLCSVLVGRAKDLWSTLALAGIIILAAKPHALFNISFQLSFGAVCGIILLAPLIFNLFKKRTLPRPILYLAGIVSATVSATLFLMPVTSYYFNQLSLVSIVANILVLPILGLWVLPLGLASCLVHILSQSLASLILSASALGADLMLAIIGFFSGLEWASIWVATPSLPEMILFLTTAALIPLIGKNTRARTAVLILLSLMAVDAAYWHYKVNHTNGLSVTYLDVAQGNSALLEMPGGKRMLIDGGGFSKDTFDVGRFVIAPFLWSRKIRTIDYLVLTHPQADHMNGLRFIAKAFSVKEFWHSGAEADSNAFRELMSILRERGIKELRLPQLLERKVIEGVSFQILHPPPDARLPAAKEKRPDLNNFSIVLKAEFEGASFIFPGDVEAQAERGLAERAEQLLSSDVLLAPHHGSRTSCTEVFLSRVRPRLCVISSGKEAAFGFPHKEAIERIKATGAVILRTDQEGAVEVSAIGNELKAETFSGKRLRIKIGD
jgi:competence protein ComEC